MLAAEFVKLAELPCLEDLVFVGNPLEEKHSAEGNWIDEATKRVPKLKKLDGEWPWPAGKGFLGAKPETLDKIMRKSKTGEKGACLSLLRPFLFFCDLIIQF